MDTSGIETLVHAAVYVSGYVLFLLTVIAVSSFGAFLGIVVCALALRRICINRSKLDAAAANALRQASMRKGYPTPDPRNMSRPFGPDPRPQPGTSV